MADQDRFDQRAPNDAGLEHGGRLAAAAQHYGIPASQWLDLSTGINPRSWPVPSIPTRVWQRLPEDDDQLEMAARSYYGAEQLLAVAGSQAAIQLLPRLRPASRVGFLSPGYGEHPQAWQQQGHQVQRLNQQQLQQSIDQLDVIIVCRPNNPDGTVIPRQQLLRWHQTLAQRGGWLVVDEAFADTSPDDSVADLSGKPGCIVLRSLGKFFGLAGLRLGFVLAEPDLLQALAAHLGPWTVSHPARWIGQHALQDQTWQQHTRQRLRADRDRLDALLSEFGLAPAGGTELFRWLPLADSRHIQRQLALQGVLLRRFDQGAIKPLTGTGALRIGLPGAASEWTHLRSALQASGPATKP